jgi:hypothetical protein
VYKDGVTPVISPLVTEALYITEKTPAIKTYLQ